MSTLRKVVLSVQVTVPPSMPLYSLHPAKPRQVDDQEKQHSLAMGSAELEHVQHVWDRMRPNSAIYRFLLSNVQIVSAGHGIIKAHLKVEESHLNSRGTLHGTVSACLTDWAGGLAIASQGVEKTGVSTDIHTSYLSTARLGDWLEIEGKANKVGSTLAFTTVTITKLVDGNPGPIVATGTHTKYVK